MSRFLQSRLITFSLALVGVLTAFHPMVFSGFSRMQTDAGDTRFTHYLIEHVHRWISRDPRHLELWNPPFFYPLKNAFARSDLFIGAAWFYSPLRFFGLSPENSYQGWMILALLLNFGVMAWFLRRYFSFERFPSAVGAYLFAFGSSRVAQLGHQQLLPQFYVLFAFAALIELIRWKEGECRKKQWGWSAVFCASIALQLATGFYWFWFLFYWLVLLLCIQGIREPGKLGGFTRVHGVPIIILGGLSALALFPILSHYAAAARETGGRSIDDVMLPQLQSWFFMPEESWLYFWQKKVRLFQVVGFANEQHIGVGLISLGAIVFGLKRLWRHAFIQAAILTSIVFVVLLTDFRFGIKPWKFLHEYVPASGGMRAMPRIGLFLLFMGSVGIASAFQRVKKTWVALLLLVLVIAEQGQTTLSYPISDHRKNVAQITTRLKESSCSSFLYTPNRPGTLFRNYVFNLDAMWASMETGVPTLNGYSGSFPSGWNFDQLIHPGDREVHEKMLENWKKSRGLNEVCWLIDPNYQDFLEGH